MGQIIELDDFSGGVTDYYLNAPPNKMKTCHNLLINSSGGKASLVTRPGSIIHAPKADVGPWWVNSLFLYPESTGDSLQSSVLYHINAPRIQYLSYFPSWGWVEVPKYSSYFSFYKYDGTSADSNSSFCYATWNNHIIITHNGYGRPRKVFLRKNQSTSYVQPYLVEAGLPKPSSNTTSASGGSGSNNYLYKFVFRYDYTMYDGTTFQDFSSPSSSKSAPNLTLPITLSNLPSVKNTEASWTGEAGYAPNTSSTQFDLDNIKLEIYRTTNNGTVFYKVAEVSNSTTSYIDSTQDSQLNVSTIIYTNGGVVENDRPPRCKVVHIMRDTAYYGNCMTTGTTTLNYRLFQSVPGDIDSVPATFYVDVDDEIMSVSSTKNNVIILCKKFIYRVDGSYDEIGRGGMVAERISDTAGCISHQCAVQALDGVFWLGNDGAYFTDGFRVIKLNQDYDKTYKIFVTKSNSPAPGRSIDYEKNLKVYGKFDNVKNRIWWGIRGSESSTEIDSCYVLDLNFGINENSTFTTVGGDWFYPSAIEFVNGSMIRANKYAYFFIHGEDYRTDPKLDPASTSINPIWGTEAIKYQMETVATNFGTSGTRKYVTHANIMCESNSNLSLLLTSHNDDSSSVGELLPIRYRNYITFGSPDFYWGDSNLSWNKSGLISEKRRFPAKNLRCNFKSLKLTSAKVAIISSDIIGTVNVDNVAKTATLTNSSQYDFPDVVVDYFISFENDGYVKEFQITERVSANTVKLDDPDGSLDTASDLKWVIRGYPKGDTITLHSLSMVYDVSGPTLNTYKTADSGEVKS